MALEEYRGHNYCGKVDHCYSIRHSDAVRSGWETPKHEYMDKIKGGTRYIVIKRRPSERKKLKAHHPLN